ncbi:MAG: hypothetical protein GVY36_11935 [Verrucomicrobia bacterium]|jgi:hypothetical protein|nr:hypothetical protein [Verrucomicrobiota bacterium]
MKLHHLILHGTLLFAQLFAAQSLFAQFEDIWHTPSDARSELEGITMRDPLFPGVDANATFYQGVNKSGGANQTGGSFYYRIDGGSWQSTPLNFSTEDGSLQFWSADLSMPATVGAQIEYYFFITLDNRDDTYLYKGTESGENQGNVKSLTQADAEAAPYTFSTGPTSESGNATLTVNGVNANYATLNFYIDEIEGDDFPDLEIVLDPGVPNPGDVQVFTNLNNRERADDDWDGDGIEDGIIPPDGNAITLADTDAYFQAHAMSPNGNGDYTLTLPVEKTGAYRVTARFKQVGDTEWTWLRDEGIRDLAVVVAPTIAREMTMYELHVTNANATGPSFAQRGTFEDLHDPNARVNMDWLNDLGLNWIWFQPFHPQGIDGRETDPATEQPYDPGSPYSIRNFWEINPLYSEQYNGSLPDPASNPDNYAAAMQAFQDFADAADQAEVNLMLDFPFNHTAPDVVLADKGVELFAPVGNPDSWQPGDLIRDRVPQFFSTNGSDDPPAYSAPAQSAAEMAVAPDRNDFGKWDDVRDVYFGNYSTLVTGFPDAETSRAIVRNEDDLMFYDSMGPATINVWRYFGEVLPYWIEQSGHRGFNSTSGDGDAATRRTLDRTGIDGLRKDFGQGLPPQAMEYIINRTHSVKWNFVFMSESLDGEQITYRSSRHFAILNENIVFPFKDASTTQGYRGIFESRRDAYGDSLVLLNNLSHDEEPWADPWQPLIRYAAAGANDGVPMIMYGQEIGAAQKAQDALPQGSWDYYEVNFGKNIPHFKKWNSLQPQWTAWDNNDLGVQHLYPVYSAIGKARQFSPALRSNNRWFLNRQADDQPRDEIHAVAKYTEPFAPAAQQDVVFAFVNLRRDNTSADTFGIPTALADQLGIDPNRRYNVKNIAAYTGRSNEFSGRRDDWLWGTSGRTGQDLRDSGIFVALNPVPADEATWETAPFEAQYLKLYDITAPATTPAQPNQPKPFAYAIGDTVTFDWDDVAPDAAGVIPHYEVSVTVNGGPAGTFITTNSQYVVNAAEGDQVSIEVRAVNPNDASQAGPVGTSSETVTLLAPDGDADGDGMRNADEDIAGTNPLDSRSTLRVRQTAVPQADSFSITWEGQPGVVYQIDATDTLSDPDSWQSVSSLIFGDGGELNWIDETSQGTNPTRFYRIRVVTP